MTDTWINSFYHVANGLGYHHPVHPALVHVPIGLAIGALFFGLAGALFRREDLTKSAFHCMCLAALFWFPVVLFGYMDWKYFYGGARLTPVIVKMVLAVLLLLFFGIAVFLGFTKRAGSKRALVVYALSVLIAALTGFFGAQLVYTNKLPRAVDTYKAGAMIYEAKCAGCHPRGGNVIKPDLPVVRSPKTRDVTLFTTTLRNAVPPMPSFPASQISDSQAKELYDYIINVLSARPPEGGS